MTLRTLDLFSGIGGFSLGLERTGGFETKAFCEIDPFCRRVLAKHWPDVPCHDDVCGREFKPGEADVVAGGFPCQDISSSGGRAGLAGDRSGLWREMLRAIRVVGPQYAIVENVADLLHRGLGEVLGDLAEIGHDAEWHCLPAADVGLPQGRDRIWIVAYPDGRRCETSSQRDGTGPRLELRPNDDGLALAQRRARQDALSEIRGMDDGLPDGLDRLTALGNAVVPQIPELIGNAILSSYHAAAACEFDSEHAS